MNERRVWRVFDGAAQPVARGQALKLRLSHRNYLAHAYLVSQKGATELLQRYDLGFTSDGAMVSLQNSMARQHKARCFHVHPCLMTQHSSESNTSTASTWKEGLATAGQATHRAKRRSDAGAVRSGARIPAQSLRTMRREFGRRAGQAKAGGSSNQRQVQRKQNHMLRYADRHNQFPSKKHSAANWQAGTSLWRRVRKQWLKH